MGRPSTRQSVTIAVSIGRSSSRTREGSSSRVSGGAAGSRPRIWYSSSDQTGLVRQQVPLGAADPAEQRAAAGERAARFARRAAASGVDGTGGGPSLQLAKVLVEVVELVQREVAQRALPAPLGVRSVARGASRRTASTSPLSRRVCVISASTEPRSGGWAAGRSAERWDGMTHSDAGTVRPRLDGRTVTTVAQAATRCKGFGNTRYGGASGICHSLRGAVVRSVVGTRSDGLKS